MNSDNVSPVHDRGGDGRKGSVFRPGMIRPGQGLFFFGQKFPDKGFSGGPHKDGEAQGRYFLKLIHEDQVMLDGFSEADTGIKDDAILSYSFFFGMVCP